MLKTCKLHIIGLALALTAIFSGCKPETGDTIILVGEETAFMTVKELMNEDLNDAQQNAFLSKLPDLSDNTDVLPPDIMGEYKISPKQFVESNIGFDFFSDDHDVLLRVFNQQNRLAQVDFFESGVSRIDDAYVIGEGNFFTLYFTEEREIEFMGVAYSYERLIVITGEKVTEGIRNLRFGNIILNVENGIDPLVGDFEPGWFFIYKDADGLSEKGHWF